MTFWLLLTVNSVTFGGLLFLLSAGFSLIFGLMRIPNLTHGSMFMLGAYFGTTLLSGVRGIRFDFWLAALICALKVALLGALMERLLLRRLAGQQLAQVLVTLGVSFMVADLCLMGWGGDPISVATPAGLNGFVRFGAAVFPLYRLAVIAIAIVFAIGLWLMLDRTPVKRKHRRPGAHEAGQSSRSRHRDRIAAPAHQAEIGHHERNA